MALHSETRKIVNNKVRNCQTMATLSNNNRVVCGMVLGEASESDEDSDAPSEFVPPNSTVTNFGQSSTNTNVKKASRHKLKYNTLLHYKLRKYICKYLR